MLDQANATISSESQVTKPRARSRTHTTRTARAARWAMNTSCGNEHISTEDLCTQRQQRTNKKRADSAKSEPSVPRSPFRYCSHANAAAQLSTKRKRNRLKGRNSASATSESNTGEEDQTTVCCSHGQTERQTARARKLPPKPSTSVCKAMVGRRDVSDEGRREQSDTKHEKRQQTKDTAWRHARQNELKMD